MKGHTDLREIYIANQEISKDLMSLLICSDLTTVGLNRCDFGPSVEAQSDYADMLRLERLVVDTGTKLPKGWNHNCFDLRYLTIICGEMPGGYFGLPEPDLVIPSEINELRLLGPHKTSLLWNSIKNCHHLKTLTLRDCRIDRIPNIDGLESLCIQERVFGPWSGSSLARNGSLQHLILYDSEDIDMKSLAETYLRLSSLELVDCTVCDLDKIVGFRRLMTLKLDTVSFFSGTLEVIETLSLKSLYLKRVDIGRERVIDCDFGCSFIPWQCGLTYKAMRFFIQEYGPATDHPLSRCYPWRI